MGLCRNGVHKDADLTKAAQFAVTVTTKEKISVSIVEEYGAVHACITAIESMVSSGELGAGEEVLNLNVLKK